MHPSFRPSSAHRPPNYRISFSQQPPMIGLDSGRCHAHDTPTSPRRPPMAVRRIAGPSRPRRRLGLQGPPWRLLSLRPFSSSFFFHVRNLLLLLLLLEMPLSRTTANRPSTTQQQQPTSGQTRGAIFGWLKAIFLVLFDLFDLLTWPASIRTNISAAPSVGYSAKSSG